MKINEIELIYYDNNDFVNRLAELENETESADSVLIKGMTYLHAVPWDIKYNIVVMNNIYQTSIFDKGAIVLYIRHPEISDLKELYLNIVDNLFEDDFKSFNPVNQYYYRLHVEGIPYIITYHDPDSKINSSLIFIPNLELISADLHPKYSNEEDIINLLSSL